MIRRRFKGSSLAFCEGSWATDVGPWHVREVTDGVLYPGGGVPNPALCGRDLRRGWDLPRVTVDAVTVSRLANAPRERGRPAALCPARATAVETRLSEGQTP